MAKKFTPYTYRYWAASGKWKRGEGLNDSQLGEKLAIQKLVILEFIKYKRRTVQQLVDAFKDFEFVHFRPESEIIREKKSRGATEEKIKKDFGTYWTDWYIIDNQKIWCRFRTGISRRTIQKHLQILKNMGVIKNPHGAYELTEPIKLTKEELLRAQFEIHRLLFKRFGQIKSGISFTEGSEEEAKERLKKIMRAENKLFSDLTKEKAIIEGATTENRMERRKLYDSRKPA